MIPSDEPCLEDALDHHYLAALLSKRIRDYTCPHVMGICGSWGSGKTSFLRKVRAFLGGEFDDDAGRSLEASDQDTIRKRWFGSDYKTPSDLNEPNGTHLIWFNPWHHQFEQTPLVALLHEIRQHLSMTGKALEEAKKLTDVTLFSALTVLSDLSKAAGHALPGVKPGDVAARGREYESDHFLTGLTSQRFRAIFEKTIEQAIGKQGRLVIFIDDLDRCEGDVAFRLLEALKLYLNARNCVYILGIDRDHLEVNIAKALSGSDDIWRNRPRAREYLGKMFQSLFILPVPERMDAYILELLDFEGNSDFPTTLKRFNMDVADEDRKQFLVRTLNDNLPHNPRKIKSFVASWKLYVDLVGRKNPTNVELDWRISVILHYLGQFEEPIFRMIEAAPEFYDGEVVRFCREGARPDPVFQGLILPYNFASSEAETKGGFDQPVRSSATNDTASAGSDSKSADSAKTEQMRRAFPICNLIMALASDPQLGAIGRDRIRQHIYSGRR